MTQEIAYQKLCQYLLVMKKDLESFFAPQRLSISLLIFPFISRSTSLFNLVHKSGLILPLEATRKEWHSHYLDHTLDIYV